MTSGKSSVDELFSYDELPYGGNTHASTHPRRIGAIARLFGVEPVDLRNARVLEIGCGLGDDLLPLAAAYPDTYFIGIDLGRGGRAGRAYIEPRRTRANFGSYHRKRISKLDTLQAIVATVE